MSVVWSSIKAVFGPTMCRTSFIVNGNVLDHFSAALFMNTERNDQFKCTSGMGKVVFDDSFCVLSDGVNNCSLGVHCHGQIGIFCSRAVTCGVDSGSDKYFLMNWKVFQVELNSVACQCFKFDHVLDVKSRFTVEATADSCRSRTKNN